MLHHAQVNLFRRNLMVELKRILQLELLHKHIDNRLIDREFPVLQPTMQQAFPHLGFLEFLLLQIPPNLVLGLLRNHHIEPVGTWRLLLAGDDFHLVAVGQFVADGHHFPIHARAVAGFAHAGVHLVGEIEHRGADGQLFQVAFGRENEDLIGFVNLFI